ncbi:S8 family serine peptidase [Streptomyces flaveus]
MDAEGMWKVSTGKGVKVAVLDTGVNPDTSSLKGQVLEGEVPRSVSYNATKDYDGHGTTMAELIAGTGAGGGLQGLAPGARIVPYRVVITPDVKSTTDIKKTPSVADAIRAAADSDAQIINMSFGDDFSDPDDEEAIKYAQSKGKLMFAGTGNEAESKNFIDLPAAYPYVVGVAAANENGKVGEFSEHGHYVDLAAPGLNLPAWCDARFQSYCVQKGTSMSTAIASASAALIWSAHPDWTANQVLRSLIDTAGRTWPKGERSNYLGYGLARPRKVLENSNIDPGPANKDPLSFENSIGLEESSPSPSSSPSTSAPSQAPKKTSGGGTSAARTSSETSDNTVLWVALGAAGALVVIGGSAFAVVRSRRGA